MSYIIFDKDTPANTQGCIGSIAIDDAALEKVCPSNIRHAEIVCTVTEEQYNNVRLGTHSAVHDGAGNAIIAEINETDLAPVVEITEAQARAKLDAYTAGIRDGVEGKVDEADWKSYADSVDAIDLSGNTLRSISGIIEAAGITFRSLDQLPLKKA